MDMSRFRYSLPDGRLGGWQCTKALDCQSPASGVWFSAEREDLPRLVEALLVPGPK